MTLIKHTRINVCCGQGRDGCDGVVVLVRVDGEGWFGLPLTTRRARGVRSSETWDRAERESQGKRERTFKSNMPGFSALEKSAPVATL